jgi:hypothetical protein
LDIATNKNEGNFARIHGDVGQSIIASAITLTGGASGVGNHAQIFSNSASAAQSINATSISLTGGAGGGIDSGSNRSVDGQTTRTFNRMGPQTINATNCQHARRLPAGTEKLRRNHRAHTNHFCLRRSRHDRVGVQRPVQCAVVARGSAAMAAQVRRPTNLTLLVGGDLSMTGGSVANAGTAIGSGTVGRSDHHLGDRRRRQRNAQPRDGSELRVATRLAGIEHGGGDISVTAGGTLALNSTGPGWGRNSHAGQL